MSHCHPVKDFLEIFKGIQTTDNVLDLASYLYSGLNEAVWPLKAADDILTLAVSVCPV